MRQATAVSNESAFAIPHLDTSPSELPVQMRIYETLFRFLASGSSVATTSKKKKKTPNSQAFT